MSRDRAVRRAQRAGRASRDMGFTLIEVLISLVLSGIVAGVTVSAMLTSMNVVESTGEQVSDSTDAGLVTAYLGRDAQAAGGTDPATAASDPALGVAVTTVPAGWAGCEQDGRLVVRLAWVDHRTATDERRVVATYALFPDGRLVRRVCEGTGHVDVVLGQGVAAATAACAPDPTCATLPDTVSLTVRGSSSRAPYEYTLVAALRGETQSPPGSSNSAPVPLLVLGTPGPCPSLDLGGTGRVDVHGDVIVADSCGAAPIGGDQTRLAASGSTAVLSGVSDPLAGAVPPVISCPVSGPDPAPVGAAPAPTAVVVHPRRVTLTGTVHFAPGRYVFCDGLEIAAGATVTGTGVLWYVAAGTLTIDEGAAVDVAAPVTGPDANLLAWVAAPGRVELAAGSRASNLRGLVYAPAAEVVIDAALAIGVGGIVAREVSFSDGGAVRLGLPIPTLATSPSSLPRGQAGAAYPSTVMTASGGTAPYSWSASGLPAGLVLTVEGVLAGTPAESGTFTVVVTAIDAGGAATSAVHTLDVAPPLAVAGPGSLAGGTVGQPYPATTFTATGGTAPYTWAATGLPTGLVLGATGQLGGTPTAAGTYSVTVTVTDASGATATAARALTVAPAASGRTPFGPAQRFQVMVEGAATIGTYGLEGAVAVGGALTFRNWQTVASAETSTFATTVTGQPAGLMVGGAVDLVATGSGNQLTVGTGFLHTGSLAGADLLQFGSNVHLVPDGVTDSWTTPRVIVSADQTDQGRYPVAAGVFPFAATFAELRADSARLATLNPTDCPAIARPTVTEAWGNYTLTLVPGRVNVWNLTLAQVVAMGNVSGPTAPDASTQLIVNVTDSGSIVMPARYWAPLQSGLPSSILWNFPNASSVTVSSVLYGSLLAPSADVTVSDVQLRGDIAARTLRLSAGSGYRAHFTTPVPCLDAALTVAGPAALPDGQAGTAYPATALAATGGPTPHTWTAAGLPPGMTISTAGVLGGTPTSAGSYTVTVTATDASSATAARTYPLTVAAPPDPSACPTSPSGWTGEYHTGIALAGTPVLCRDDAEIDFDWAGGRPAPGLPTDNFSVRWTRVVPLDAGSYTFTVGSDDGARLYVDGVRVGDWWVDRSYTTRTVDLTLTAGSHTIVLEYYERGGHARATLEWDEVVPATCPTSFSGWKGEYHRTRDLTGFPVLCRDDPTLSFDWGSGAPAAPVPADDFSVRWTRTVRFDAGTYTFTVGSDDGARLYIDGTRIGDWWWDRSYETRTVTRTLSAGMHTIVLEYYERGGVARASLTWRR